MKKIKWLPLFYSLLGIVVLGVLALINLNMTGTTIATKLLVLPIIVGLLGGYFLGLSRKKWYEKNEALNETAAELKRNMKEVEANRVLTSNLTRMMESLPLPVSLKDENFRYLLANRQYETLTGTTWEKIKGKTDFEVFPHPIAELFREQDEKVINRKEAVSIEETVPLPVGIKSLETFRFPMVNDEGHLYAVGGICTDITNLKQAEDSLNSQQEQLDVVLRCIGEGVIVTDCDRKVMMFNQKAEELTEHDCSEAKGALLENVYLPLDPTTGKAVPFWKEEAGMRSPVEYADTEVIIKTQMGHSQTVVQKTVTLKDRFGQKTGILIIFHSAASLREEQREHSPSAEISEPQYTKTMEPPVKKEAIIMIMDDDALVRKTCGLMLATKGYTMLQAKDGTEAIELYESRLKTRQPIKAIIMDLTVPGAMGGLEATDKILELDPDARIMVASGYSNDPIMANYSEYGFLARIEKPFAVQKLIQTVEELLEH